MVFSDEPCLCDGATTCRRCSAEMYLEDIYTIGINLAGLPAISIPNGFSLDGKPMGLQLIGPQKEDRRVINAAHVLEKDFPYHLEIPELVK